MVSDLLDNSSNTEHVYGQDHDHCCTDSGSKRAYLGDLSFISLLREEVETRRPSLYTQQLMGLTLGFLWIKLVHLLPR